MSSENTRASPDPSEVSGIPVTIRKKTDAVYFKLLVAFSTFLVVSVIVGAILGDFRYVSHGYDDSGNFCGLQNERIRGVEHSGANMTEKRYLEIRTVGWWRSERRCVETCPNGHSSSIVPRCRTTKGRSEREIEVSTVEAACFYAMLFWREIVGLCFLSMCLCVPLLTLLKFHPVVVLWTLLPLVSVASVVWTTCFWISFIRILRSSNNHSKDTFGWIMSCGLLTAFTVAFFVTIVYRRNKIKLMAPLFEECGRCIATMPTLLLQPFQTLLSMALLFCFVGVGLASLDSSGQLVPHEPGRVTFKIHKFFQVTGWLLLFGCLWISQFLLGCQCMTVSGAVVRWYFTRNKADLSRPVRTSLCTLFRYHLGSVALGSLIRAVFKAFHVLSDVAKDSPRQEVMCMAIHWLQHCVLYIVQLLTKNVYVMIALYGESFCRSVRLSYDLMSANRYRVAAAEGVCGLFLTLVDVIAATIAAAIGSLLFKGVKSDETWIPVGMVLLFSFLCCHCLSSVYGMTIDTVLFCFCVDCAENDGVTKPYYMGKRLEILLTDAGSHPIPLSNKTQASV